MLYRPRYYSYDLITGAAVPVLSLAEIKEHLKIDPLDVSQDAYLISLEQAVVLFAEKYTKRDFINKTYRTFRDSFLYNSNYFTDINAVEIRRSRLQSVVFIQAYTAGVLTVISPLVYQVVMESDFGFITPFDGKRWPETDRRYNGIEIQFVAGYGATAASVPADLKNGLLQHIARIYENRGDCDEGSCGCAANFPTQQSKAVYDLYRIMDISI